MNTIRAKGLILGLGLILAAGSGEASNPLALGEASNPLATLRGGVQGFHGTFADSEYGLTIELEGGNGQYTGQIVLHNQSFPVTAQATDNVLSGTFESSGNRFSFTATLAGDILTLVTQHNASPLEFTLDRVGASTLSREGASGEAQPFYGLYVGTMRIKIESFGTFGPPFEQNREVMILISEPQPDKDGVKETNPFHLQITSGTQNPHEPRGGAPTPGDLSLLSATTPTGPAGEQPVLQYWTFTSSGQSFDGSLSNNPNLNSRIVGKDWILPVPCIAEIAPGAEITGAFTGTQLQIQVSGMAGGAGVWSTCQESFFVADITAARR